MTKTTHIDHLGRSITLNGCPKRVISLVPSQTELLIKLGLKHLLVGITNYCIHPEEAVKTLNKIGGTKTPKLKIISALAPDLVIANKEENNLSDIEQISKSTPVWVSNINNYEDNFKLIYDLGSLFNKNEEATALCRAIKNNWNNIPLTKTRRCLYFIWRKPYMLVGKGTFIDSILLKSGFDNIISDSRYPTLSDEKLSTLNPEIIFLSSEPYSFKEKHISEFKNIFPNSIIKIVDGELFSWYGSRQNLLPSYLIELKKSI